MVKRPGWNVYSLSRVNSSIIMYILLPRYLRICQCTGVYAARGVLRDTAVLQPHRFTQRESHCSTLKQPHTSLYREQPRHMRRLTVEVSPSVNRSLVIHLTTEAADLLLLEIICSEEHSFSEKPLRHMLDYLLINLFASQIIYLYSLLYNKTFVSILFYFISH